ncbi:hypothetical protein WICPIJ_006925 [Wickerhamomyces pijperi]|uniref:Uncharacterized protein n=1 Tax=Wickerhamomyces pijperi TaxID=599730 RepID=A0A9P8Q2X0_WICPI|nr:hypothetical protein WICPIJ_006925 [Wickerhamomyces pijperi]
MEASEKERMLEDLPPLATFSRAHLKISASDNSLPCLDKDFNVMTMFLLMICQTKPSVKSLFPSTISEPSIPTKEKLLAFPPGMTFSKASNRMVPSFKSSNRFTTGGLTSKEFNHNVNTRASLSPSASNSSISMASDSSIGSKPG